MWAKKQLVNNFKHSKLTLDFGNEESNAGRLLGMVSFSN